MANQATEALAETDYGTRQRVLTERAAALRLDALQLRCYQWMIGNREWESRHDHVRQRFTRHIDTGPEAVGAEQWGILKDEFLTFLR